MAEPIKPEDEEQEEVKVEAKETGAKLVLTKEVADKIEEGFKKLEEKQAKAQKEFRFHGSAQSEAEFSHATKKKEAIEFIRAVATDNKEVAGKYSDQRAKSLNMSSHELYDSGIVTKAIRDGAALGAGSNYLVPTVFETEIHEVFDRYDELISDADVQNYNKPGYIFNLNELVTKVVVWPVDEDAVGLTASQPTYSEPQLAVADWMGSVDITQNFLEDTEVDIMSDLSKQFAEEMAKKFQARLINGDVTLSGVVTKGVLNTAGLNEVLIANTTGGYSTVTAQDIENAYFNAISINGYQDSNKDGTWYMSGTAMSAFRSNIRLGSTLRDNITVFDAAQMTLLGRPVKFTNQFPTPATTTSNPFILYGNLKKHLIIRRKRGITMKVNDSGTSRSGRNLNYQLGRELVVSQRIGHQVVLAGGLTVIST